MGIRCECPSSDRSGSNRDDPILVFARGDGHPAREHHGGQPLLQSAYSAAGAVSPIGWLSPEDPLVGVALHMKVTRQLKRLFPNLIIVGTAYSYFQEFLPNVAQAAVREGWTDLVGLGRMILTYPELLRHATEGNEIQHKRICRTFSDCTTAPRKGLPSGCYPLDSYYKSSALAEQLKLAKAGR